MKTELRLDNVKEGKSFRVVEITGNYAVTIHQNWSDTGSEIRPITTVEIEGAEYKSYPLRQFEFNEDPKKYAMHLYDTIFRQE